MISTPSKCGTTWMQMICGLLIFQTPRFDKPLDAISPWLDTVLRPHEQIVTELDGQSHRRFIKTHTPMDGLPYDARVSYLCVGRDPRDVAMSWDNHFENVNRDKIITIRASTVGLDDLAEFLPDGPIEPPGTERDRFWSWVDQPTTPATHLSGLESTLHHLSTFWRIRDRSNVVLLRYEDLLDDLEGQMRSLAARLSIDVPDDRWPDLVGAATFGQMKARAGDLVPESSHDDFWKDTDQFFHHGTSGQWRRLVADDELSRYAARVGACAGPDLAAWVHRPPLP